MHSWLFGPVFVLISRVFCALQWRAWLRTDGQIHSGAGFSGSKSGVIQGGIFLSFGFLAKRRNY